MQFDKQKMLKKLATCQLAKTIIFQIEKVAFQKSLLQPEKDVFYISGYASTFGNIDTYGDIVEPTAFDEVIDLFNRGDRHLVLLHNHYSNQSIGVVTELRKDAKGLWFAGEIATDITDGEQTAKRIARGIIKAVSIGYYLRDFFVDKDGYYHLTDIDLFEISAVALPANDKAIINEWKNTDFDEDKIEKSADNILRTLDKCQDLLAIKLNQAA